MVSPLYDLQAQAQTIDSGAGQDPAQRQIPIGFSGILKLLSPSQPRLRAQDQVVDLLPARQTQQGPGRNPGF
jgi:hypothetical protein